MFVPDKLFKPSQLFVGEARNIPLSGTPERCFSQLGFGLTCKHLTRLEKLVRDKHSSLLWKSVHYRQKSFIILAPGGQNSDLYLNVHFFNTSSLRQFLHRCLHLLFYSHFHPNLILAVSTRSQPYRGSTRVCSSLVRKY